MRRCSWTDRHGPSPFYASSCSIYSTWPGLYKSSAEACSYPLGHRTRRARGTCRGSSKQRPSLPLGPLQAEPSSTALAAPSRQLPSRPQPLPRRHLDRMLSPGNSSQTVITPPFLLTLSETADIRRLLRYGHPGPFCDMGNRLAFASSYDRRMRNPSWVKQRR